MCNSEEDVTVVHTGAGNGSGESVAILLETGMVQCVFICVN